MKTRKEAWGFEERGGGVKSSRRREGVNGLGKYSTIAWLSKGLLEMSGGERRVSCGVCLSPARLSCMGTDREEVGSWMKQDLGFCSGW